MSASPTIVPTQSTKRPLEDPSSPSAPNDQPEAKRPALDKVVKNEEEPKPATDALDLPESGPTDDLKPQSINGARLDTKDGHVDTEVPDAPSGREGIQSIESTVSSSRGQNSTGSALPHDESGWIHIRAVITSAEAATVIGKGGENVSLIRKMSGAKCTVSDYQKGAVERILTVSGVVDAAAKAFGLIIRTLNNEPLEDASTTQSKTYPLRLLIPHILIGSVIGKGGVRIREIQEASGARLNASDSCLPLSTERSLVVLGVADSVHIATYYVGSTLFEQLSERFGGPAASAYASRSGGPAGVVPGGMQVVPYVPQPAGGNYGHPDNHRRNDRSHHTPGNHYSQPYGQGQPPQQQPAMPMHYGGSPAVGGYGGVGPQQPQTGHVGPQSHAGPPTQPIQGLVPGQPLTQQIYIPNDMVGAIIGKGGQKINEIRQLSTSVIKINEPQDNSNERLVTITGTAECNQMALYMLYSRLEIAYITLKPNVDISSNFGPTSRTRTILTAQEGYQRSYYGTQLESPNILMFIIDWDNVMAHQKFKNSPAYGPLLDILEAIVDDVQQHHLIPNPFPPSIVIRAPCTEFATFYNTTSQFLGNVEKFANALEEGKPEGYICSTFGPVVEKIAKHGDMGNDGVEKGNAVMLLIGWESKEMHLKFRETELFKTNIRWLRTGNDGAEIFHIHAQVD